MYYYIVHLYVHTSCIVNYFNGKLPLLICMQCVITLQYIYVMFKVNIYISYHLHITIYVQKNIERRRIRTSTIPFH